MSVAILTGVLAVASVYAFIFDYWLRTLDIATQFVSWYSYIGERLGDGEIPAWFPYDGSGESIVGASASGWMTLPVMVLFTLFGTLVAYKLFIVWHIVVAGYGMYAFARQIGMLPTAALVASVSFALGSSYYGAMTFMPPAAQVMIYIPVSLFLAERCLRSRRVLYIVAMAMVIGVCFSQMYTGSAPRFMYGVGFVVAWMLWRIAVVPGTDPRRTLTINTAIAGMAAAATCVGFGAAAILPQLAYSAQSHIPHGDYSQVVNGDYASTPWTLQKILIQALQEPNLFNRPYFYGAGLLVLALLAPLVSRLNFGVPLFAILSVVLFDISWTGSLLRGIILELPGVGPLVEHRPTSSVLYLTVTIPLMAGAATHWFLTDGQRPRQFVARVVPLAILLCTFAWLDERNLGVGDWQYIGAVLATLVLYIPFGVALVRRWRPSLRPSLKVFGVAIAVSALLLPTGIDAVETLRDPNGTRARGIPLSIDDVNRERMDRIVGRTDPGTAAEFLQQQQAVLQPFRIAAWSGYDNELYTVFHHMHDNVLAMLVHARASFLGLEQVSSYNPIHLKYYVDYVEAMNQERQDYHTTDVRVSALRASQLLDMLNVRYIIVPKTAPSLPPTLNAENLVFEDPEVWVFENPGVFPRAWIVHDLRPAADDPNLLQTMNSYLVDGRYVAFVDEMPAFTTTPDPVDESDRVLVTGYEPEEITLQATTSSEGLLVLSEVYADGWNAYVDGERVDVIRTNHTFRGVPIGPGEHEVVLRYEPREITVGLAVTGVTSIAVIGVWGWALVDNRRRRDAGDDFSTPTTVRD